MADPVWYYARGETERGPFTTAQLKALAAGSRIRPDDLVWKEGTDTWIAAADVADLFPATARQVSSSPADSESSNNLSTSALAATAPAKLNSQADVRATANIVAQVAVVVGVSLLVLANGCEATSRSSVERLETGVVLKIAELDLGTGLIEASALTELRALATRPRSAATDDRLRQIATLIAQQTPALGSTVDEVIQQRKRALESRSRHATTELTIAIVRVFCHVLILAAGVTLVVTGGNFHRWCGAAAIGAVGAAALFA